MREILQFLSGHPALAIFFSLAVGYCIGKIKIGSFTIGPTIGTLLTAFILSRFTEFAIPGILSSVFSLLFCFTIGYEAGPAFFKSLRSQGIKLVLQSVFFCVCAFGILYAIGCFGWLDRDSLIGMAAGALTQTSILTVAGELGDSSAVVYAITYIFGTVFAIVFVSFIGPAVLRITPQKAVKEHLLKNGQEKRVSEAEDIRIGAIQPRAYRVEASSQHVGTTVDALEAHFSHGLQVVKLFRGGEELPVTQSTTICAEDLITVLSPIPYLLQIDDAHLTEVSEPEYTQVDISVAQIIVTEEFSGNVVEYLSSHGILLQKVTYKGKTIKINDAFCLQKGMVLKVSGIGASIQKVAERLGYVKQTGSATDVPFVFFAASAAVILGALKLGHYSFGESTCALIVGLLCGWLNNHSPKHGQFPESARWFLKSVGLNLFIAVKTLGTGTFTFDLKLLLVIGISIAVTLLTHLLTLLFCKYVLRMDAVNILGGQCGSGTCTAAINSLTDLTGSPVFTASFATTNAISNILLTVVGVVVAGLL